MALRRGARGVLGDVRRRAHRAQIRDEVAGVVGLVRRHRDAVATGAAFDHHQRRIAFAVAVGRRDRGVRRSAPSDAPSGRAPNSRAAPRARALSYTAARRDPWSTGASHCVRCSPWKFDRRVAAAVGRRVLVARPETLLTGPRLQQRAVHREMLVGQQPRRVRMDQHRVEERRRDVAVSNRSRFFVNVVGDHTASSMPSPTNQRNSRL